MKYTYDTPQKVFNKVAKHLITQKKRSRNVGTCLYRSEDGLSCAVGCLIKDKFYSTRIEGNGSNDPIVKKVLIQSGVMVKNKDIGELLDDLQSIHDNGIPSDWRKKLVVLANSYELKIPKFLK